MRVAVVLSLGVREGGGGGGGCFAEPWKGEEQACLRLCLEAGLGCCRGKNS